MQRVVNEWLALGMMGGSAEHLSEEFSQQLQLWNSTETLEDMSVFV